MMLNTHSKCSGVAVVVCNSCMANFNCSASFGTTLPSNRYNAQRSLQYLTRISHARTLRWSCVTRVWRISTAQHPSVQLCRRISTTPNDPYDTEHAFHMLGRCGGRLLLVYGTFPLLNTLRYNSAVEFHQRPTIPTRLNTHFTCSDVAVVVCSSCKANFKCSTPFGTTLPSNCYNAKRSL